MTTLCLWCGLCLIVFRSVWSSDVISKGLYADPSKALYRDADIACNNEGLAYYRNLLRSRPNRRQTPYLPSYLRFPRTRRAATADPDRLWQDGVIPYEIGSNFTAYQKAIMISAMRHWENYTCITFVERTNEPDFIVFTQRPCGCCSFVGRELRGAQAISIGKNCDKFGIVVHELGHVVGYWHEHTRPDRDKYIKILTDNIKENHENNFVKMPMSEINSLGEEYDFSSIMHYARNTFSRTSDLDTILPITQGGDVPDIGQRVQLSVGDIIQTNKLYKCPSCGATHQESSGTISFKSSSGVFKECQWRITAAYGEKIILNITSLTIVDKTDVTATHGEKVNLNDTSLSIENTTDFTEAHGDGEKVSLNITSHMIEDTTNVTAAHSEKVNQNITPLKIEDTTNITAVHSEKVNQNMTGVCSGSFLEIRDGHYKNSPLIGRFCGAKPPPTIESTGNRLWLAFRSNFPEESGFSLKFEAKCGGFINKDTGQLTSPNYPDDYHPNKNCVWVITVKQGFAVGLIFDYLEIEDHEDCVYDHLEIRDGVDEKAPVLAMLCGYSIPPPVQSTSNQIYIKFFSDDSVMKRGFSLSYLAEIDECATDTHGCQQICINTMGSYRCDCKLGYELHSDGRKCEDACGGYLDTPTGTIYSPSFPDQYPPSKTCVWQIRAPMQYKISLDFTHFNVEGANQECEYDFVEVTDGDGTNKPFARFCGKTLPATITSNSSSLQVKFKSDDSVQQTGFQAKYFIDKDECAVRKGGCQHSCINTIGSYMCACHNGYTLHENKHDCKEDVEGCRHYLNDHKGVIVSPLWPKYYPSKANCEWRIKTAPGHRIKLRFEEFSIEPQEQCLYDYVEVFTSPDNLLGKYCGGDEKIPDNIFSDEEELIVKFQSDESVQRNGFQADYSSVCGGNLKATSEPKVIFSHAKYGDQNYPNHAKCEWTIEASPGARVSLKFNVFDLEDGKDECGYDVVELYDGSREDRNLLGSYCDVTIPPKTITKSNKMIMVFRTDNTVTWKGFSAEYQEVTK